MIIEISFVIFLTWLNIYGCKEIAVAVEYGKNRLDAIVIAILMLFSYFFVAAILNRVDKIRNEIDNDIDVD